MEALRGAGRAERCEALAEIGGELAVGNKRNKKTPQKFSKIIFANYSM